jgi:hypothetical protein
MFTVTELKIKIQIYFAFYKSTVGKPVGYRISYTSTINVKLIINSKSYFIDNER